MSDLIVVAMVLAFFGVAVALLRGCERIIGSEADAGEVEAP